MMESPKILIRSKTAYHLKRIASILIAIIRRILSSNKLNILLKNYTSIKLFKKLNTDLL